MPVRMLSRVHSTGALWYALPLTLASVALFVLAFDQGQLLSTFLGQSAYQLNWVHEFFHDARHAAGFPCH
ncbi:MAG: CbtB-domain containing protein [Chloroflexi bacterium]|nr:CbtB-domain containing protein [Chloroflexota bacterium]